MAHLDSMRRASVGKRKTKQTQVLGMDVSDVNELYLKPVLVRNASSELYEELIARAAESIAQKICSKTADVDDQNPYVQASRVLSMQLRRSLPSSFISPGLANPHHSRPLFGKLPRKGAKAGALKRARMQRLYDIIPEVPFESALRATCVPGAGTQAVNSLLHTYVFSKVELPLADLQHVVQVLVQQSHTTQARAAAVFLRNQFFFSAMKCVYASQALLRDVLDLMRVEVVNGLQEDTWESAAHLWNWNELDKDLFVKQFAELKVIHLYKQVRGQLKVLKSQGSIALARIEREMLLKVIDDFLEQMDPSTAQVNVVQNLLMEVVEDQPQTTVPPSTGQLSTPAQDGIFGRVATANIYTMAPSAHLGMGPPASANLYTLPPTASSFGPTFNDGINRDLASPVRPGNTGMRPGTLKERLRQLEAVLEWERAQHRQRLEREREVMRKLWAEERRKLLQGSVSQKKSLSPDQRRRRNSQDSPEADAERARLREELESLQRKEREAVQRLQKEKAALEAKLAALTALILPPPALKQMQDNLESRHQQEMQALQSIQAKKEELEQELSRIGTPVGNLVSPGGRPVSLSLVVNDSSDALRHLETQLEVMAHRIRALEAEKHELEQNLQSSTAVESKLQVWQARVKELETFLERQDELTDEVMQLKNQLQSNAEERNKMEERIRAEQIRFQAMQEEKARLEQTLESLRQVEERLQSLGDSQLGELQQQLIVKQAEQHQLQQSAAAAQQQIAHLLSEKQRLEVELQQKAALEEELKAQALAGASIEEQLQRVCAEKKEMELQMQRDADRIAAFEAETNKFEEHHWAVEELRTALQQEQLKRLQLEGIKADVEHSLKLHASSSSDTGEQAPEWEEVKKKLLRNLEEKRNLEEQLQQQEQTMARLQQEKTSLQLELDQVHNAEMLKASKAALEDAGTKMASREVSLTAMPVDNKIDMLVAEMSEVEGQLKSRIRSANRAGASSKEASENLLKRWQQEKETIELAKRALENRLQEELLERQLLQDEVNRMRESEAANQQLDALRQQLQAQQQELEAALEQSKQQVSRLEEEKKTLAQEVMVFIEAQKKEQLQARQQIEALTADKQQLTAAIAAASTSAGGDTTAQIAYFENQLRVVTQELDGRKSKEQEYREALNRERQQLAAERATWESEKAKMEADRQRMLAEKHAYERDKTKLDEDMVKTMNMLKDLMSKTVLHPPMFKHSPGDSLAAQSSVASLATTPQSDPTSERPITGGSLVDTLQASLLNKPGGEHMLVHMPPSATHPEPEEPPTKEEVEEYAIYLGLDLEADRDLLYIAEWALTAPLPENWTVHLDNEGNEFFYNTATNESTYEHPMDNYYKEYYKEMRAAKLNGTLPTPGSRVLPSPGTLISKFGDLPMGHS